MGMIIFGLGVAMLILTIIVAVTFKKKPLLYENKDLQYIDDTAITIVLKNSYQTERQNQESDKTEQLVSEQIQANKTTELLEVDDTSSL